MACDGGGWSDDEVDAAVLFRVDLRVVSAEADVLAVEPPPLTGSELRESLTRLDARGWVTWFPEEQRVLRVHTVLRQVLELPEWQQPLRRAWSTGNAWLGPGRPKFGARGQETDLSDGAWEQLVRDGIRRLHRNGWPPDDGCEDANTGA